MTEKNQGQKPAERTKEVVKTSDDVVADKNAAPIGLVAGGRYTVNGQVVDANGQPIKDA